MKEAPISWSRLNRIIMFFWFHHVVSIFLLIVPIVLLARVTLGYEALEGPVGILTGLLANYIALLWTTRKMLRHDFGSFRVCMRDQTDPWQSDSEGA